MTGGMVSPYLNPANWHPGDAHAHSKYSKLDLDILFWPITRWNLLRKALYRALRKRETRDLWPIDGSGEALEASRSARRRGLSWVCMTEHGPNLGMPPLIEATGQNLFRYNTRTARNNWGRAWRELCYAEEAPGCCHCMMLGEELSSCWHFGHLLAYRTHNYLENGPAIKMLLSVFGWLFRWVRFRKMAAEVQRDYIERVIKTTNPNDFCFIAHPIHRHYYSWNGFEESLKGVKKNTPLCGFELLNDTLSGDREGLHELLETWDRFLADGYRVRIIGGSDGHAPERIGVSSKTYIYSTSDHFGCHEVTHSICREMHDAVLQSLRHGHSVVTDGPLALLAVFNDKEIGTSGDRFPIIPGETLKLKMACGPEDLSCFNYRIICSFTTKELEGETPAEIESFVAQDRAGGDPGALIAEIDERTEETDFSIQVPNDPGLVSGYVRVEGYGPAGTCYTNPVFLVTKFPKITSQGL